MDHETLTNSEPFGLSNCLERCPIPGKAEEGKFAEDMYDLIEEVGEVCFGPDWRKPLATTLGLTTRTLNRWKTGETELTDELIDQHRLTKRLLAQLAKQERKLASLRRKLERIDADVSRAVDNG